MDQTEAIEQIQRVIANMRPAGGGTYHLCLVNKKITIFKTGNVPKSYTLIAHLDQLDINTGLVGRKWSRIETKIRTLIGDNKL